MTAVLGLSLRISVFALLCDGKVLPVNWYVAFLQCCNLQNDTVLILSVKTPCTTQMEVCAQIAWHDYNAAAMYLRVLESNKAAIQFYEGLGFEYCHDRKEEARPELLLFRKRLQLPIHNRPFHHIQ